MTSAFADTVTMICTYHDKDAYAGKYQTRYLKYSNPLIGPKQIYMRRGVEWEKWCSPTDPEYYKPCERNITDRGAVGTFYLEAEMNVDDPKEGLSKGDEVVSVLKYTLDFEFITRRLVRYWETTSGKRLKYKGNTEVWACELHNSPNEKKK